VDWLMKGTDMMNSTNQLIRDIVENLRRIVNGNKFHKSFDAYRYSGALEALLINVGFLNIGEPFEYLTGGKKYFPLFGDFRWKESYSHFILRKTDEYLSIKK
jgi:hypothetical protein